MFPPSPYVTQTILKWRTEGGGQICQPKGRQHREREREKGKTVYGRKKRTIASVTISVSVERYRRKKRDTYADGGTRNVPLVIGTTGLFTFRAFPSLPTLIQVIRGRLRFRTLRLNFNRIHEKIRMKNLTVSFFSDKTWGRPSLVIC